MEARDAYRLSSNRYDARLGQLDESRVIVVALGPVVDRKDVPELCAKLDALLANSEGSVVVCDVSWLIRADAAAVNALARLRLTARRSGYGFYLRQPSAELQALLAFFGLSQVIAVEPTSK